MSNLLSAALAYAEKGWHVFPLETKGKKPITQNGVKDATCDPEQIQKWWNRTPTANIGIACGPSGICVIDVDEEGQEAWLQLQARHAIPQTLTASTGNGHHHIFSGHGKNTVSKIAKGIDTRGEGGYIVAPPSIHPNGLQYKWTIQADPAPYPEALKVWEEPATQNVTSTAPTGESSFRASSQYIDAAIRNEYNRVASAPEGQRNDTLNRAAYSLAQICALSPEKEQEAINALRHAAGVAGLDGKETEATLASGFKAGRLNPRAPKGRPRSSEPVKPKTRFPGLALGEGWLGNMCRRVAESTETPIELAAMIGLGVLATAAQRHHVVEIVPGYQEPLCLWTACCMPSGSGKSTVYRHMIAPLIEAERNLIEQFEASAPEINAERDSIQAQISRVKSECGKAQGENLRNLKRELADLYESMPDEPAAKRMWAQDCTPEHLGTMMSQSNEAMAILSDEGGLFDMIAGRYSDGIANLDLYLQGYSGSAVRVDRGSRPPVILNAPRLTITLTPQPEVLTKIGKRSEMRTRGLFGRFLYAVPEDNIGYRTLTHEAIPLTISARYALGVLAITGEHQNTVLTLTSEARNAWKAYQMEIEHHMRPNGKFYGLRDWAGKLAGQTARIAGLLHLAGPYTDHSVDEITMTHAIEISKCLTEHAFHAFDLIAGISGYESNRILSLLQSSNVSSLSMRELWRQCRYICSKEQFEGMIEELVQDGYIAVEHAISASRGRPKSPAVRIVK